MNSLPVHRSILAVDIEGSTGPLRTNPIKEELRQEVYRLLDGALTGAGIETGHCDPFTDRGDGVLALIHPVDQVPKTLLLNPLLPVLTSLLVDYNTTLTPAQRACRGMRLRVVVHAGEVHSDGKGYFGESLDLAFRLLDAPALKKCLRLAVTPLVLVVSEDFYWSIVAHQYDGIPCQSFQKAFRVECAGRRRQAWVHVPSATAA
jgi:hypothetical protein